MRASAIEFRLRMAINAAIILFGFWAPWMGGFGAGRRVSLLEWLALELSRTGLARFTVAAPVVIVVAALLAAAGAALRVWGTAYLGPATVQNMNMRADAVMADGPYRYLRNPLYVGLWCTVAATAFLMPPSGALVTMALLTVFLFRLTLGEETFLSTQLGEPYLAYFRTVPRFLPRLRFAPPRAGARPHWLRGIAAEIFPIGVFIDMAFLSWSYNDRLMLKALLISLGVSLILRALLPSAAQATPASA
ncbi:MAG TPA: methyltransferase [Terracidiphilus sp.]|jgi:protein-S-isoprenylcysteine O-methyltransferase Ste14|nr:methyltransferase [Terracidiphilus sp.]